MNPALAPTYLQLAAAPATLAASALVPRGAVVEARVLSLTPAAAVQAAYEVLLAIGGRTLKAVSRQPLPVGASIQVTSDDGQRLRLLPAATAPASPVPAQAPAQTPVRLPVADKAVLQPPITGAAYPPPKDAARVSAEFAGTARIDAQIDQALRTALPREQPLKPVLRTLHQILNAPATPLRDTTAQLVRDVLARLPDLATLQNPQRLPDALRLSGVFLENTLRQLIGNPVRTVPGDDLRVRLLRLAANLRAQLPADGLPARSEAIGGDTRLLELVQSALAHLKVNQLSTLNARVHNQPDAPAARAALELPFLHSGQIESVTLSIGRDAESRERGQAPRQAAWTADLDFELGELGALHVRARLQAGQLSATFWAPRSSTLALVKRHVASLRDELARHDLRLQQVAYHQGSPPNPQPYPRPLLHVAI